MSLREIETLVAQLPRPEQEELLRSLVQKLKTVPSSENNSQASSPKMIDRDKWVAKLQRLQSLTDGLNLRPTQEILDELREDRI